MKGVEYRFIEPLDVLFLRGNKLFGDPGSYGEALIPPWPSVAAGAIRSHMLVDDGVDLDAFSRGAEVHPSLGTPAEPGSFALTGFYLARRNAQGGTELLMAQPADLVIAKTDAGELDISRLEPRTLAHGLQTSGQLPQVPVLAQGSRRSKPESGYWLTQAGWTAYLNGGLPESDHLLKSSALWSLDGRVGIGMDSATRSVESGKLFSMQAIAMHKPGNRIGRDTATGMAQHVDYTVGFVAGVQGAIPPSSGLLRFGGDGRAASLSAAGISVPEVDYAAVAASKRCRIVLTSPGLFPEGWKLPGTDSSNRVSLPGGLTARLESAALPRSEVLSGWDLANWKPKDAQRVAPTGSVYWLADLQTASGDLENALRKLAENGLWNDPCEDPQRRAEGFNRCTIGVWP